MVYKKIVIDVNHSRDVLVLSDKSQVEKRFISDIETFGFHVSSVESVDLAKVKEILNADARQNIELVFILYDEKKSTGDFTAALVSLSELFSSDKLIILSNTFDIERRMAAYSLNVRKYLQIPYDRFELEQVMLDAPIHKIAKKISALFVDNHQPPHNELLDYFEENHIDTHLISDPYLLNEALDQFECDLIFLRLTGVDFCCHYLKAIKGINAVKGISVIVLSDQESRQNEDGCLSSNADAFFSLPYNYSSLLRKAKIYATRSQTAKQQIKHFNSHYYEREREHVALDAHALVSTTDLFGRITYVNDSFCVTSGYSAHELIGHNHRLIRSGLHSTEFYQNMWLTISQGGVWKGEICNQRKDGSLYWVQSTITTFLDDQGKPYQYISVRTDITDKKESEKNLKKTIDILEKTNQAARIGSWEFCTKTQNLIWSKVTKEIHCVPENYNPNIAEAIEFYEEGDNRDRISSLFNRALEKGIGFDDEFLILTANGGECWARVIAISEFKGDECERVYGLFQDITDKKNTLLSLIHAKENAESANVAKSEFLSQMSHELRTPLNAILGFSQLLQGAKGLDQEEKDDVLEIIKAGKHLLELINEILDLSAVESGKLNLSFESISVDEVIKETINLLSPLIEKRNITIIYGLGALFYIKVDRVRFKQIILNLLSNAIKYNIEEGSVKITIQQAFDDQIKIEIEDSGVGIAEDKLH